MTEAQARAALAAFDGLDGLEAWIAEQPWKAAPGSWTVAPDLEGWRFKVEPAGGAVRVTASMGEGAPAGWPVPGRPPVSVDRNGPTSARRPAPATRPDAPRS